MGEGGSTWRVCRSSQIRTPTPAMPSSSDPASTGPASTRQAVMTRLASSRHASRSPKSAVSCIPSTQRDPITAKSRSDRVPTRFRGHDRRSRPGRRDRSRQRDAPPAEGSGHEVYPAFCSRPSTLSEAPVAGTAEPKNRTWRPPPETGRGTRAQTGRAGPLAHPGPGPNARGAWHSGAVRQTRRGSEVRPAASVKQSAVLGRLQPRARRTLGQVGALPLDAAR